MYFLPLFKASLSSQMDVSKFALDRNSYLGSSGLYDTSKGPNTSPYVGPYLDPSVLTKAYFDSKIYQDRANYAFDISKIYSAQQHNAEAARNNMVNNATHINNNNSNLDERDSSSQMSDAEKGQLSNSDGQLDTQSYSGSGNYQYPQSGDFRRPLTVIFWPDKEQGI